MIVYFPNFISNLKFNAGFQVKIKFYNSKTKWKAIIKRMNIEIVILLYLLAILKKKTVVEDARGIFCTQQLRSFAFHEFYIC